MTRAVVLALAMLLVPAGADSQQAPSKAPAAKIQAPADGRPAASADGKAQPVTVDADHMEAFRKESLVVFRGNVVARQNDSVQYADRMEVYLDEKGERVVRTVSTGNIRILTQDCRTGTAQRAEYYDDERRVELIGNARVWEADNVVSGDRITIFVNEDRSIVQGGKQERVKAVFYPKNEGTRAAPAPGTCKR